MKIIVFLHVLNQTLSLSIHPLSTTAYSMHGIRELQHIPALWGEGRAHAGQVAPSYHTASPKIMYNENK